MTGKRERIPTRLSVAVLVAFLLFVTAAGSAGAQETVTGCEVIDSPGEYVVANDISEDEDTCIQVTSDDVVLDGAGNTVTGVNDENSTGVSVGTAFSPVENVTIENLVVTDWGEGISLSSANESEVRNVEIRDTEKNGISVSGSSNLIVDNILKRNEDAVTIGGLFFSSATDNQVRDNTIEDNNGTGVVMVFNAQNNVVENNDINNNSEGVGLFLFPSENEVRGNTVSESEIGVFTAVTNGSVVSNNLIEDNKAGFVSSLTFNETISDNEIVGSNGAGIALLTVFGATLTDNTARGEGPAFTNAFVPELNEETDTVDENDTEEVISDREGNVVERLEIGPSGSETVVSFESSNVTVDGEDPATVPAPPSTKQDLGLYFNATDRFLEEDVGGVDEIDPNQSLDIDVFEDAYLDIDVHYEENDLSGVDESELSLWRYDDATGDWEEVFSTVDTSNDVVDANITEFSTFGVFTAQQGPSVKLSGSSASTGESTTVNIDAQDLSSVTLRNIPTSWSVASSQNDGASVVPDGGGDNIAADGNVTWEWSSEQDSVAVSVTLDVPSSAQIGDYTLEAEAVDDGGNSSADTAVVAVDDCPVEPVVCNYGDDSGNVELSDLQDAIDDFVKGNISLSELQAVIDAFVSN